MSRRPKPITAFRHEALLYAGLDGFVEATVPFLRDAVSAGEPTLVIVDAAKIERLRAALGGDGAAVMFADMAEVGVNPARIIPAWREFLAQHASTGTPVRGIGEPVWRGRSPDELVECQRHESLLNVAFAGSPAWWLVCPYDTGALEATVIDEARRSHPFVMQGGAHQESTAYRGLQVEARPFDATLPEPPERPAELAFGPGVVTLRTVRELVARHAAAAGLGARQAAEVALAVHEVAANSLLHGGGRGTLRLWRDSGSLVCEVRDSGHVRDPLVGRQRLTAEQTGGRGLWLANHLCDLVQLRSFADGTVVRLHLRTSPPLGR